MPRPRQKLGTGAGRRASWLRFRIAGQLSALVVAGFALALWWPRPTSAQPRALAQPQVAPAPPADPRAIYLRDCAVCHGPDGKGTFRGPQIAGVGRASVDYALSTGRMPLVAAGRDPKTRQVRPLPEDQLGNPDAVPHRQAPAYPPEVVSALVDYVAGFAPGGPDIPRVELGTANLASGGELFRLQCAACHSWAGNGGALLHREAPSLHRATPVQIAEAVRAGPGAMPAFGTAALNDAQLNDVVGYVRYLDHPEDRGGQPLWHLGPVAEGLVALIGGLGALLWTVRWIGERG